MEALNVPISMLKRGLSPEEAKEIVSSKIDNVFMDIELQENQRTRLNSIMKEVMKCVSYSIRDDGYMDRRRCSPKVWQDLGVIPAPEKENEYKIPERDESYIEVVTSTKQTAKSDLHFIINQLQLLVGIDLERDGQELPADVKLCRKIDCATRVIASWYVQGHAERHQELINSQKRMIQYCLKIAICQIVLMIIRDQPFDILTQDGYKQWKSSLGVIASCAALSIVLDLFDDQTFIIPDNIVD